MGPGTPVVDAGAAVGPGLAAAEVGPPLDGLPERYALVVGDAGPRKGVDRLLDIWDDIADATGLGLVIAGGRAASPELIGRIERSAARLVRLPSDAELATLYTHATLVADASAAEGFGFPRAEARHFGLPYVALRDGGDPVLLVEEAVASGPEAVSGTVPTWDDVAERTVAVYRRVLETRA